MSYPHLTSAPPIALAVAGERAPHERAELEARRVAEEFESIFMAQLAAPLGPSEEAGEDDMFRSDATDMYRRMFSEQMAGAIAKGGGIGLADVILSQLQPQAHDRSALQLAPGITKALDALRAVRSEPTPAPATSIAQPIASLTTESVSPNPESFAATRPRRVHAPDISSAEHKHFAGEAAPSRLPLEGQISSRFGARRDPVSGARRFHHGVDIAAAEGTPIGAVNEGTVIFSGRQGGYGNTVVIEHADGRQSRYAHADQLLVKKGDAVRSGQIVATVGSTGRSTGPHLHLEVSENGRRIDPLRALAHDLLLARR